MLGYKRAGEMIGKMALLYDEPRSAAAIAEEETTVLKLGRDQYTTIVGGKENVIELLAEQASRHLQQHAILADTGEAQGAEEGKAETLIWVGRARPGGGMFARKFPIAMTEEPLLSGVACLAMVAGFFKRPLDIGKLAERQLLGGHRDDLFSIGRLAEANGYMSRLLNLDPGNLHEVVLPGVVQSATGDLAVVYRVSKSEVTIGDPIRGILNIPRQEFAENLDGRILTISFVPDFGAIGIAVTNLYKQFFPLLRPYWPMVRRIVAITLLLDVLTLLPPFFTAILIDNVLVVKDWNLLILMLTGLLVSTLVNLVTGSLREFLMMHLMRRLTGTLFVRFFGHILSLPLARLKKWQTGELMARFEENEKVLDMASNGGLSILMNTIAIFVYLPILFVMDAKLAAVTLVFVVATVGVILFCAPRLRAFERQQFEAGAALDSHTIEVVKGISTIKALAQEETFIKKGKEFFAREMKIQLASERFDNKMELVSNFIQQGSNIALLGFGAWLVLNGSLTPGLLIAFTGIASQVTEAAEGLANFYDEYLELQIALDRINDVLSSPREPLHSEVPCPPLKGHLRFNNVKFSYDPENGPTILSDINLEFLPGEKVAFVGRSGSGKSTLVNLVNRLLDPTEGTVSIDGVDVSKVELSSLRRQIGVVEQVPFIFGGSIRDNISKTDPSLSLDSVVSAATLAGIHEFIDRLPMRYDTRIGEGGRSLSGGQAQRLVIARALATDPQMLILDEATAALDTESERIIQNNLDRIMEARTTLVIAHRLSTIRDADVIIVMDKGMVAEKGTHDELMDMHGIYYYLTMRSEA